MDTLGRKGLKWKFSDFYTPIIIWFKLFYTDENFGLACKAARTPNAILLDASKKERLLELRYTLILLSNI